LSLEKVKHAVGSLTQEVKSRTDANTVKRELNFIIEISINVF